jgi:hypothetical protein
MNYMGIDHRRQYSRITLRDKYFVFCCDGRTCVIVPVFPSNYRGEL